MIHIDFDEQSLMTARAAMALAPKEVPKAAAAAINRTTTRVRKTISKAAAKRYVAKVGNIKKSFTTARATASAPTAELRSTGRALPLTAFRLTTPKRGPVRVKVLRAGAPKRVKGLFLRDFPRGYHGPMLRVTSARYPLKTPAGPSVPAMVGNKNVTAEAVKDAETYLNQRFMHEISYRLGK